ncbi:MAG: hypothetical protein ACRD3L_03925 [Terriglobales bacterium]
MLKPINLRSLWLLAILGLGFAFPAVGQAPAPGGHGTAERGSDHPAAEAHKHSVKLSWHPSTAATKLPRDAVVGYNIYRSSVLHDPKPERLNSKLWTSTTYVDKEAEAGKTYFYVIRGVTAKGVESGPSNEIKVVMPPR